MESCLPSPATSAVRILIAEQESQQAGKEFAEQETKQGRATFYHDFSSSGRSQTDEDHALDQPGLHFIYKPDLTPDQIVEETEGGFYHGVRVRPKTVLPAVHSLVDMRIGTGVDNFKAKISHIQRDYDKASQEGKEANFIYILMNTPAQNAVATAEYTQFALCHGLCPALFNQATQDVVKGKWVSSDLSKVENPYKISAAELRDKTVVVVGMGNIGQAVALRLKHQYVNVIGWGYTRSNGEPSFSLQDAQLMGIGWSASLEEAVEQADGICVHTPGAAVDIINNNVLSAMKKDKVVVVNAARACCVDKKAIAHVLQDRLNKKQSLIYYEDSDIFRDNEDAQETKLKGPLLEAVELHQRFPDYIRFTPHWGGDRTPETDYNAAMQGYRQYSQVFWNGVVFNCKQIIGAGSFRKDAKDNSSDRSITVRGDPQLPNGIGRLSTNEVNARLDATSSLDPRTDATKSFTIIQTMNQMVQLLQSRSDQISFNEQEAHEYVTLANELFKLHDGLLERPMRG